ncbi:MAG: hypothetical protein MI919_18340, partial [Holophagales bacterium]|nr:hypothetical protein [Holophagales bacterium]
HLAGTAAVLAWLQRRGRAWQAGLAALLLALVGLPWIVLAPRVARLDAELDRALQPRAGVITYVLSPERSAEGEPPSTHVNLGDEPEWLTLALQLSPNGASVATTFRIRLLESDTTIFESGPTEADAEGRVTLRVHSSWLAAATYHVELDALATEGGLSTVARFAFEVRRGE